MHNNLAHFFELKPVDSKKGNVAQSHPNQPYVDILDALVDKIVLISA